MSSWGAAWARQALERLDDDVPDEATVLALLAIRAELHTANLLAAAASVGLPITAQGMGASPYTLAPEAKALRDAIRDELDVAGIDLPADTDTEATS